MQQARNSRCPNCRYVYPGTYCPECGLEHHAALETVRAFNRRALKGVIIANLACLPSVPYLIHMAMLLTKDGLVLIGILLYYPPFIILHAASYFMYRAMISAKARNRIAFAVLNGVVITSWLVYLFVISDGEFINHLQRELLWAIESLKKSF